MKTTKPISTISFNCPKYLIETLNSLLTSHVISFYCFIHHLPEDDEKKEHIHMYLELNKSVDTESLRDNFKEIDLKNPKPKGVLPFQKSKFADWYYYCMHDASYLVSKQESRKYHYCKEDFVSSDDDYLLELLHQNPKPQTQYQKVEELRSQGFSIQECARFMNIPLYRLKYFYESVRLLESTRTERGNHAANHDEEYPF